MSSEHHDINNMMQDSISMTTIIGNNENNNDISSSIMDFDDQNNYNNNNNNNHQHLGMSEVGLTDYSFSLFLQTSDTDFFFPTNETESPAVPVAKASHLYTKEDLKPVRCMASFLYLVFRNPNLYEVTFFKAGSRTYDETKQQSDEVEKDNKRRYVTAYGTDVTHIWYVYLSIYLFLYLFTLLSLGICGWLLGWNNFANLSILLYFFF
jgi:hypothetical protein